MHLWKIVAIGVTVSRKKCCNDQSTFAICDCALITSSLLFESWNHSSIQRYSFKNSMYCFHFVSEKLKDLFVTQPPFVVCAIHSRRNKFPFRSEDCHFVPSISPFLIDPLGKSHSLCLFIKLDIWICCLSIRSLSFPPPIWSLSDSSMYMVSPLPDVCNSSEKASFCTVHEYCQIVEDSFQFLHI